jgi:hypothetical protein
MARTRGGASRPGSPRGENGEARIKVRCPNPDCEKAYSVPARYAGKRARCTECGTKTLIPALVRPAAVAGVKRVRSAKAVKVAAPPAAGTEVRIGCIGRGHAGKTALFHALGEGVVGDFLPSGLHLDAADPREVARMIREAEGTQRLLRRSGLPPTLEVSQTRYCVYERDERRVLCRMREVIGQVLTHTLPDSEPQLQARYTDYLKSLVNAHVLWAVVPCPPFDPGPADSRRYANDLRIITAYLRESLRLRTLKQPAAVALVLSKMDALFDTPEQARESLTDAVIRKSLGPLIQLIAQSPHVSDAAIVPVTAFGFGKAVLREDGGERQGTAPESLEEPFGDEPIWLLREGESPQPYNLDALFLWSLLMGMLTQAGPDLARQPQLDRVCRMLRDDLEDRRPWLVPIKGGVKLEAL